jgi:hypothetical protein
MAFVPKHWIQGAARWGARTIGSLAAGFFFLFLLGEGFGPHGQFTLNPFGLSTADSVVILLRVTACIGLLLAWRWEALGACIALACMVAATIIRPWVLGMVLALVVPGVLYLLSWFLRREDRSLAVR